MICGNFYRKGTLEFVVLQYWSIFFCGILVILILNNCSIAIFSEPAGCVFSILDSIKTYSPSPPMFSEPFPDFNLKRASYFCKVLANKVIDECYFFAYFV